MGENHNSQESTVSIPGGKMSMLGSPASYFPLPVRIHT